MRMTESTARVKMQDFIQLLFDKTDPKGYDVSAIAHGPMLWRVTIENLHDKDVYDVYYSQAEGEWQWIRVLGS